MDPVVVLALVALSALGALALTLPPASTEGEHAEAAHAEATPAAAAPAAADPPSRLAAQEPLAKAAGSWTEVTTLDLTVGEHSFVQEGEAVELLVDRRP